MPPSTVIFTFQFTVYSGRWWSLSPQRKRVCLPLHPLSISAPQWTTEITFACLEWREQLCCTTNRFFFFLLKKISRLDIRSPPLSPSPILFSFPPPTLNISHSLLSLSLLFLFLLPFPTLSRPPLFAMNPHRTRKPVDEFDDFPVKYPSQLPPKSDGKNPNGMVVGAGLAGLFLAILVDKAGIHKRSMRELRASSHLVWWRKLVSPFSWISWPLNDFFLWSSVRFYHVTQLQHPLCYWTGVFIWKYSAESMWLLTID